MSAEMVVSLVFISNLYSILTLPVTEHNREKEYIENLLSLDIMDHNMVECEDKPCSASHSTIKRRVKRAGGGDKFSNAATMTETKMFQMYLQLFKNLFASSYIGGSHPLHPDVPKPVLLLFKQKMLSFFFPPVGDEGKKV